MSEDSRKHHCEFEEDRVQTHVHEFEESTKVAERCEDPHDHRYAGISGEALPEGKSHVHEILTNTDFYENHYHKIKIRTGQAIEVGDGRHVHFTHGKTTLNDGHVHDFEFTTLIENPIGERGEKCEMKIYRS